MVTENDSYAEEPLYYISVVAKIVDLHPQTLRHYERIGLVEPKRTDGNARLYSQRDVERLRKISRLTSELGVNLAGVEVILNLLDRIDELQQEMSKTQAELESELGHLRRDWTKRQVNRVPSSRPAKGQGEHRLFIKEEEAVMIENRDLQELVEWQPSEAQVLSIYLSTDLSQQQKEQCRLILKEKLREIADKSLAQDAAQVESFFDYEYDWQSKSIVIFSCQKRGFWRAFPLELAVSNTVFAAERPYLKPLSDLLGEYEPYAVVLVDQEGARFFVVQLGEIKEADEVSGEAVKRHKQGGWSQAAYQRRVDMQVLHNLKAAVGATVEFCKQQERGSLVLAGGEGAVMQFQALLPKDLQRRVIGAIPADIGEPASAILGRSMEVVLKAKRQEEDALVRQMVTAASKGVGGVMGLADTAYAVREGRVRTALAEQGYEAPGALCEHCGYVSPAQGQKCLFCGHDMRPVDNAVDLVIQKTLEAGGEVKVLAGNQALAAAGHIGAILRY